MRNVASIATAVRSKNAGPFWLTIDVFCPDSDTYEQLVTDLQTAAVARALDLPADQILRFDIPSLRVIKFSLPRPTVQGGRFDRDLHGAQWATLIGELPLAPG